jgi:hypothetical protein
MRYVFHRDCVPLEEPTSTPRTAPDTLQFRNNDGSSLVQEVFQRSNGTLGFRYLAWVNFADAGGEPHHLWHVFLPKANLITDNLETAKAEAEADATQCGAEFGPWQTN